MADVEAIWAARSDEELLEAARELGEYTEEAERVIRAELRRRGLPPADAPVSRCARCGRSIFAGLRRDRCSHCGEPFSTETLRALGVDTSTAGLVTVLRTADAGLIPFAGSLLDSEGIEYLVRGDNLQDLFGIGRLGGYNYITGPAELWVHANDAERARTLLADISALPQKSDADSSEP